jgi:hypothetical protein
MFAESSVVALPKGRDVIPNDSGDINGIIQADITR